MTDRQRKILNTLIREKSCYSISNNDCEQCILYTFCVKGEYVVKVKITKAKELLLKETFKLI